MESQIEKEIERRLKERDKIPPEELRRMREEAQERAYSEGEKKHGGPKKLGGGGA